MENNLNKQETQAIGKYIRLSVQKTRRVLDQIRGKKYQDALLLLEFMPYKPCKVIKKILISASHNISTNNINRNELIIIEAFANEGPKLKRFQPRAQGRAFPIHKPTCHITIKLST